MRGPLRVTERAPRYRFAALLLCAYLPVALFGITHHEMWRDEVHCWLVARDSATPWDVVLNRAYDGHPPLWYLLLWVLEKTTHAPVVMQIVHVGIAAAVIWVFATRAPFPRWVRALFPFGYFLAYEYVAISRCYGMALLLALLLCVHHPRRLERPWVPAVLLAALALTTTVATVVAAAYASALAVEWLDLVRRRDARARRAWLPIAAAGAACLAAALCAWPPADSTVAHVALPKEMPDDFAPTRLIVALAPVPRVDFFFWNSNALLSFEPFRHVAVPVALLLAAWLVFVLSRGRFATILFVVGTLGLAGLFGLVYGGDVRHHGFFFVVLLMGAWLDVQEPAPAESLRGWRRLRLAALVPTLGAVLAIHVVGTPIALYYEYRYIFSSGGRAAAVLRQRGLAGSLLVAEMDYPATAVLGQLGDASAYSPRTGRTFSFVKWKQDRRWDPTDGQTLSFAAALGALHGQDATLIMNRPLLPELVDGQRVSQIAALYDSMIEEENFYLYRVARGPSRAP